MKLLLVASDPMEFPGLRSRASDVRRLSLVLALAFVLVMTSPAHDMHHVASAYYHLPHFLQAFLGAQHFGS